MTIQEHLTLYLLSHILGDYYLQWPRLAEQKNRTCGGLCLHALVYAAPFLATILAAKPCFSALALIIIGHALIDWLKFVYLHRSDPKKKEDRRVIPQETPWIFILDQSLHLFLLYLAAGLSSGSTIQVWFPAKGFDWLRWILVFALIGKPANVSFKRIFTRFADYRSKTATVDGAGSLIGFFERALSVLFLSFGQYSALGFVMAAKSLARFKLLSEDQSFAEYYLIGTLYSMLFALLAFLLVFKLLV